MGSEWGLRNISIHALREEGDDIVRCTVDNSVVISIHALREEGDMPRGTTPAPPTNFYPRPPRGGRLPACSAILLHFTISIHALREEGDKNETVVGDDRIVFLSTPSARRATC